MPEIERMEIIGEAPATAAPRSDAPPRPAAGPGGARTRRRRMLGAALAAVLVAGILGVVAVLAVQLHAARDDQRRRAPDPSPAQRAAVAAVLAWARAVDAHDVAALDATTVPDAGVLVVDTIGVSDRPFRGRAFLDRDGLTYGPDLRLEVLGVPQAVQDLQVTLTTRLTYDGRRSTAQTVVNLERRLSGLKVGAVVMTAAPNGKLPSEG